MPGMSGNRSGPPGRGGKDGKGGRGQRDKGNPADRSAGKSRGMDKGYAGMKAAGGNSSGLAGGGGASGTSISKARWDKMSDYAKRNEFGTTSYAKYKEGVMGKTGRRKGMRSGI
jgi:hypothetical protein